jgi:hypothetical protein
MKLFVGGLIEKQVSRFIHQSAFKKSVESDGGFSLHEKSSERKLLKLSYL